MPLLAKHLMDERDRNRSFTNRGCDALHVASSNVANREDPGAVRFE
jgi:hypothetical protein